LLPRGQERHAGHGILDAFESRRSAYIGPVVSGGNLVTTTIRYTYDPLQRLTGASYSGGYTYTFAYAYDAVGNRAVQTQTITSTLVTSYTYDAAIRVLVRCPYLVYNGGKGARQMGIQLEVPDSVAQALHLPFAEQRQQLVIELALALYARGALSFGKARELAGLSKHEFGWLLGRRDIPRHYSAQDLQDDIAYAHR